MQYREIAAARRIANLGDDSWQRDSGSLVVRKHEVVERVVHTVCRSNEISVRLDCNGLAADERTIWFSPVKLYGHVQAVGFRSGSGHSADDHSRPALNECAEWLVANNSVAI